MRREIWDEISGIVLFAFAILIFLSLISYTPDDLAFYSSSPNVPRHNFIKQFGAYFSGIIFFLFGYASFLMPLLFLSWATSKFLGKTPERPLIKIFSMFFLFVAFSSIFALSSASATVKFSRAGLLGSLVCNFLTGYFGKIGSFLILATISMLSLLLATEFLISPILVNGGLLLSRGILTLFGFTLRLFFRVKTLFLKKKKPAVSMAPGREKPPVLEKERPPLPKRERPALAQVKLKSPEIKISEPGYKPKPKVQPRPLPREIKGDFRLPPLELLNSPPPIEERKIKENLEENSQILEETLRDFGLEAKVVRIERGPVVTVYELQPAPGVKITRISSLSDDIALVMKAQSVRVVAPLPGRGTVGVEIPNTTTTIVYLKEILETKEFQSATSKLTVALGKDIAGRPLVSNLQDMPHLLIAGATGSGKTVCVNALITSILFKSSPDEVKFLLIDPKMVELAPFNALPHLLSPVVTQAKRASASLCWLVNEMESRYQMFAKLGVRNIEAYNEKIASIHKEKRETESDQTKLRLLPYIVMIIDELADLMLVASREIEEAITRLAQLSRAVGIHLVLATQRPSVDVVTGVIKANFPARISFQVASKVDSRTVLDMNGADKLLGKGDMLFLRPGTSKPIRAQATFVSDAEIGRVVEFLKTQTQPHYNEELLEVKPSRYFGPGREKDQLYEEAVKVVLETGVASASILQRRLRLGFTRAARLIDMMEEEGIVGPYRGSKPREILVDRESRKEG